jgi:hypothetical protein
MSSAFFRSSFLGFSSDRDSDPVVDKNLCCCLMGTRFRPFVPIALLVLPMMLIAGCATSPPISVSLSPSSAQSVQQGQTVSISASVANDTSNKGVGWSLSGSGCSGAACGSLTNQTFDSVTYNAPTSIPADLKVTLTATSVAKPSKFGSVAILVPATVVTIKSKVSELASGTGNYFNARFSATVQNDPTDSGVTWTLTANGTPCSPACGTLSLANPVGVLYTPPASVPPAPNNVPIITAASAYSPARSDTDLFTIFDGSSACGTGGNETVLNGQYAIMLQGWSGTGTGTPIMYAASFGADGTGKITGGQDQFNPYSNFAYTAAGVIPSASSYSVGPDDRGCLTLTDQNETTFKFHFSLGGISGGIASKGDVIFISEQSATPERGAGILRRQDPTAFSLSALAPNYAFGVDGWDNSSGALAHFALAGSFAQSGGALSNVNLDANNGGRLMIEEGGGPSTLGTIEPIATGTGCALASMNLPGSSSNPVDVEVYVINSSELFFVSLALSKNGPEFSGRAIATSSSFSASSISPNYIFRFKGNSAGAATTSIGLASFSTPGSPGISGTVSGTINQYVGGTATTQKLTGAYSFGTAAGELRITGANTAASPICYLANPFDGVSAFCITTDSSAGFGILDAQPAATYGNGSLSGNFFFGSNEPGDNAGPDSSGIAAISSGNLQGVQDMSAQAGLSLGNPFSATLSINSDGSGNLGANTVAVTNGSVLYFIDETGKLPPLVQVFEQ